MTSLDNPLSPAEQQAYNAFAQSEAMRPHAMSLSMIAGLSVAQAMGPRRLPDERCLPWIWDRRQGLRAPVFGPAGERELITGLVLRQLHAVHWADTLAGSPFGGPTGSAARFDAISFSQGFMVGVNLGYEDWGPLLDSHPQGLLAVMTLGQPDPTALDGLGASSLKALVRALVPDLVQLREHWRGRPAGAAMSAEAIWQHLRQRLLHFKKPFPHDAMLLAHAQRALVAPHLAQALGAIVQDPSEALAGEWMLQHFALALLACWRDTSAYRPMLALARLDADIVDDLLGDMQHELYARALASVCDGDLQPLIDGVDDPGVGPWVKLALLEAWKLRVIEGDAPLAAFEHYLLGLGQTAADAMRRGERCADENMEMLDTVASLACDVGSPLLLGPVREWFAEGLLDPLNMDQPFFEAKMALPWAERVQKVRRRRQGYVENAADEISWWAAYTEDDDDFEDSPAPAQAPLLRDGPKIGRNDPCPCGSGQKYKKCHGAN